MKKILLCVFMIMTCGTVNVLAQFRIDSVYTFVEKMPEFPEGERAFSLYIMNHVTLPNTHALHADGKVFVEFIIRKTGKVSDVKIISGTFPELERKVLEVLRNMPNWIPGEMSREAVDVRISTYFDFHFE